MNSIHHNLQKPEQTEPLNINKGFLVFVLISLLSPPRAEYLRSECPSAAPSWQSVRLYQRSLEGRSTSKPREQEEGGDAVSSHYTPVAKRKRTTAQGEMDTQHTLTLILKKVTHEMIWELCRKILSLITFLNSWVRGVGL